MESININPANIDIEKMYDFNIIKPCLKSQKKQLESYVKNLGLTLPQEVFVLNCILSFDWNKQIIIQSVDLVKSKGIDGMIMFKVTVTAPRKTVDYVVSNPFKSEGWFDTHQTFETRAKYVYHNLYRYLT